MQLIWQEGELTDPEFAERAGANMARMESGPRYKDTFTCEDSGKATKTT